MRKRCQQDEYSLVKFCEAFLMVNVKVDYFSEISHNYFMKSFYPIASPPSEVSL